MAVNQIPISVAVRKNTNTKSPAYGKYYPVVLNDKTITTRALLEHIMSHGLGIPRSIVQAVLIQISECLSELLLQGHSVGRFFHFSFFIFNDKRFSKCLPRNHWGPPSRRAPMNPESICLQ